MAGEPDRVTGLRRLYVCLTRAVTSLVVLHEQPLPEELGGPPGATRRGTDRDLTGGSRERPSVDPRWPRPAPSSWPT